MALHSVVVVLLAAPMPTLGGYLPKLLENIGLSTDLRATFATVMIFLVLAALVASRIPEQNAGAPKDVLKEVGAHFRQLLPHRL